MRELEVRAESEMTWKHNDSLSNGYHKCLPFAGDLLLERHPPNAVLNLNIFPDSSFVHE